MKVLVLLGLLAAVISAKECKTFKCGALDSGVCATMSGTEITVNEDNECDSGTGCLMYDFYTYFVMNAEAADDYIYECVADYEELVVELYPNEDTSDFDWENSDYCVYDAETDWKSGESNPKECTEEADCEMVNGENQHCGCALDGKSYCNPAFESKFSDDWFTLCEDGDANEIYYAYYIFYARYYTWIFTYDSDEHDCFDETVYEFKIWDEVEQDYDDEEDSASSLILGSLLALLVLA